MGTLPTSTREGISPLKIFCLVACEMSFSVGRCRTLIRAGRQKRAHKNAAVDRGLTRTPIGIVPLLTAVHAGRAFDRHVADAIARLNVSFFEAGAVELAFVYAGGVGAPVNKNASIRSIVFTLRFRWEKAPTSDKTAYSLWQSGWGHEAGHVQKQFSRPGWMCLRHRRSLHG